MTHRRFSTVAGVLGALAIACAAVVLVADRTRSRAAGSCCSSHAGPDGALADFRGIALSPRQAADLTASEAAYRERCGGYCAEIDRALNAAPGPARETRLESLRRACIALRESHRASVLRLLAEGDRARYLENVTASARACRFEKS